MFDLFGAEMPLAVRFFLAFLIVLGLIGAAAWAVRRFGSARLGGAVRGRQPRLAVIEYASVDARRRLLLVRRDNVEHLVMIGGPTRTSLSNPISCARFRHRARPQFRVSRPLQSTMPRALPLPEAASNGSWPLQPEPPAPPPQQRRAPRIDSFPEEFGVIPPPPSRTAAAPAARSLERACRRLASHPFHRRRRLRPTPPRVRPAPRPQPADARVAEVRAEHRTEPRVQAQPAAAEPSAADQSLAEMAQRLEAALRKPKAADTRRLRRR